MEINIPAAYREKLNRRVFDWVKQAQLLGTELNPSNDDAFLSIETTEAECERLGLFWCLTSIYPKITQKNYGISTAIRTP